MKRLLVFASLLTVLASPAAAQQDSTRFPLPGDIESLDGIIAAYYEVVSGPVGGSADRARDESLHLPGARVGIGRLGEDGKPTFDRMSLGEFHDHFGGPREEAFYEWEIHRVTQRFGMVANVWSTYVHSRTPNGPPDGRGINSIQLHHDGARWWIVSWIFDEERPDNLIPEEFLDE